MDYMARWAGGEAKRLQDAGVDPDQAVAAINAARDKAYPNGEAGGGEVGPPPSQQPAPQRARKGGGEPPPERAPPSRYRAPKDMTLPGVGRVKKGDPVIYDEATGKYRRG